MKIHLSRAPVATLAVVACVAVFSFSQPAWTRDDPAEFEPPVVPTSWETFSEGSFPVTPSTPVLLRNWCLSSGAYAFGLMDCATQLKGKQPAGRITFVQFGTWGAICNMPAEDLVLTMGAAPLASVMVVACYHQFFDR
jgi:hypothetical protein